MAIVIPARPFDLSPGLILLGPSSNFPLNLLQSLPPFDFSAADYSLAFCFILITSKIPFGFFSGSFFLWTWG